MKIENYDLAIIGSGPGGYVAAIRAAQLNMKVLVVEKSDLGGICLNWGCIPTKSLLRSSEILSYFNKSDSFGVSSSSKFNLSNMVNRSREVSKKLSDGIEYLFKKNKILSEKGTAKIINNNTLVIINKGSEKTINAKNIIIATGASPKGLPFLNEDTKKIWTYMDALKPTSIPKTLGIIGSGAIGLEFACFYNALGSKVKVFEAQKYIAPNEDEEISNALEKALLAEKISFYKNTKVIDLKKEESYQLFAVENDIKKNFNFDNILLAVGVQGNTKNLGIENTKAKIKNNQIVTYEYGKTDDSNIYAIGDVAGMPWLAHKASHEGIECVEYIAGLRKDIKHSQNNIPSCIYSSPQVASIGLTEKQAIEKNIDIKIGRFPLSANGKALSLSEPYGFIKTIFNKNTGEILGAHMIGAEVTELINTFSLAIKLEATEEDIINTIFPHPTLSEAIHESVLNAFGRSIHI